MCFFLDLLVLTCNISIETCAYVLLSWYALRGGARGPPPPPPPRGGGAPRGRGGGGWGSLLIYTCVYIYIIPLTVQYLGTQGYQNSNSHNMEVERTECGFYCGFLLCAGPLNHRFINMCHVFAFIKRICLPGSEISKKPAKIAISNPPTPTPTFF
jgi:hypothetical protein